VFALAGSRGAAIGGMLVLLALGGLRALQRFDDMAAVRRFITDSTNIKIVMEPLRPHPIPYEATVDGEQIDRPAQVYWWLESDDVLRQILKDGALGLGETYMDGKWRSNDVEQLCGEFLKMEGNDLLMKKLGWRAVPLVFSILVASVKARVLPGPGDTVASARRHIAHHYDISTKLYERMLGPTMMYSCAYFHKAGMTLEEAQRAKMELVARKLDLRPGMRVLDLGCGFGCMAHFLALEYGVHVTGVSNSKDMVQFATERFAHPNVNIYFGDYREVEGVFDRVYSVGIFEHIGRANYKTYFDRCYDYLKDDGIMLIHTIGWGLAKREFGKSFVFKYIFPSCELPHISHFAMQSDRWHLEDFQSIGKCYPHTARRWLANLGDWEGLEERDLRFRRMWEYYLLSCISSFERRRCKLWQFVYTKTHSKRPDDCLHTRGFLPGQTLAPFTGIASDGTARKGEEQIEHPEPSTSQLA